MADDGFTDSHATDVSNSTGVNLNKPEICSVLNLPCVHLHVSFQDSFPTATYLKQTLAARFHLNHDSTVASNSPCHNKKKTRT